MLIFREKNFLKKIKFFGKNPLTIKMPCGIILGLSPKTAASTLKTE